MARRKRKKTLTNKEATKRSAVDHTPSAGAISGGARRRVVEPRAYRPTGDTGSLEERNTGFGFRMEIPKDHPLAQGPSPALNVAMGMMRDAEESFQHTHALATGLDGGHMDGRVPITSVIDARRTGREKVRPDSPGIAVQRPVKSLDLHMDQLRWLTGGTASEIRRRWWDLYFASDQKRDSLLAEGLVTEEEWDTQMGDAAAIQLIDEKDMLNRAMTFHVTLDISELVTAIATQSPDVPLRSTDVWSPAGFVVLPDEAKIPYFTPDGPNNEYQVMPIKVIAWRWGEVGTYQQKPTEEDPEHIEMVVTQGVRIFVYASIEDLRTAWGMQSVTVAQVGPVSLMDMTSWAVDAEWETLSQEESETAHTRKLTLSSQGVRAVQLKNVKPGTAAEGVYVDNGGMHIATALHVGFLRRWLLSFWHLLDEEVAEVRSERVDRPAQKRAHRLGRVPGDGDVVRVIRLRRVIDIDNREPYPLDGLARHFAHRWPVRQFYRHDQRGMGLLDGTELILENEWPWISRDGRPLTLRITDSKGLRERVEIEEIVGGKGKDNRGGVLKLKWAPRVDQGYVEVERLAYIPEHTAGLQGGFVVERYDVVSVER